MSPARSQDHDPGLYRRRKNFGAVVARALDAARQRGMTIKQIESSAGIGSTTIYGWRDGRWTRDPVTSLVNRFCDAVGLPRSIAYQALEWDGELGKRKATEPIVDDPDLRLLARKLSNPNTTAAEKLWIRRQIRSLADSVAEQEE
jgi:hypothetical protein